MEVSNQVGIGLDRLFKAKLIDTPAIRFWRKHHFCHWTIRHPYDSSPQAVRCHHIRITPGRCSASARSRNGAKDKPMFSTYSAWIDRALESDIAIIQAA